MDYRPCGDGGSLIGKNSRSDSVTKARVMDRRRVGAGQRNVRRGIIASKTGAQRSAACVCGNDEDDDTGWIQSGCGGGARRR
jgi:hypothetical protein